MTHGTLSARRKQITIAQICLAIAGFVAIDLLTLRDAPFQSKSWMNSRDSMFNRGDTTRVCMLNDLLRHHIHLGDKEQAVQNILGEPSVSDGTGENGPLDRYPLVYGPSSFKLWLIPLGLRYRSFQPELELEYGKDYRLINIKVVR